MKETRNTNIIDPSTGNRILKIGHNETEDNQDGVVDNSIRTSKYTAVTFLPLALREQFRRLGNVFFLVLGCIMLLGYFSPLFDTAVKPTTIFGPLTIVIFLSLLQLGFADLARHRSDLMTNSHPCVILKRDDDDGSSGEVDVASKGDDVVVENRFRSTRELVNGENITAPLTNRHLTNHSKNKSSSNALNNDTETASGEDGASTTPSTVKVRLQSVSRAKIYPGNIILVRSREMIPADMMLLASSCEGGTSYIETSSIDGETNLKIRTTPSYRGLGEEDDDGMDTTLYENKVETLEEAIKRIANITCLGHPDGVSALDNPIVSKKKRLSQTPEQKRASFAAHSFIKGGTATSKVNKGLVQSIKQIFSKRDDNTKEKPYVAMVTSEPPNASVNTYSGYLTLPPLHVGEPSRVVALVADHLLLRGAVIRNTEWVLGVVVFTGNDTKLVRNSVKTPSKFSRMDSLVNQTVFWVVMIMFMIGVILSALASRTQTKYTNEGELWYIGFYPDQTRIWPYLPDLPAPVWKEKPQHFMQTFLLFLTVLYNFIPLALFVSVELATIFFSYLITQDIHMYHEKTGTPAIARSSNVTDLGQVRYVFSDKTGTLTQNIMKFKRCSVDGFIFGSPLITNSANPTKQDNNKADDNNVTINNKSEAYHPLPKLLTGIKGLSQKPDATSVFNDSQFHFSQPMNASLSFNAEMFLRVMCTCHTVVVEEDFDDSNMPEDEEGVDGSNIAQAWNNTISGIGSAIHLMYASLPKRTSLPKRSRSMHMRGDYEDKKRTEWDKQVHKKRSIIKKSNDGAPFGFVYQAESPDEAALVTSASLQYGYQLINNSTNVVTIQRFSNTSSYLNTSKPYSRLIQDGKITLQELAALDFMEHNKTGRRISVDQDPINPIDGMSNKVYEENWITLAVNKFDSTRKRMSVLCRSPEHLGNLPILFCKGADSAMLNDDVCDGYLDASLLDDGKTDIEEILSLRYSQISGRSVCDNSSDEDKANYFAEDDDFVGTDATTTFDNSNNGDANLDASLELNEILDDDKVDQEEVSKHNMRTLLSIQAHLGEFASDGLRTLVLGFRILTEEECSAWLQQHKIASNSITDRSELLSQAAIDIETNIHIVGTTAIEDKLQEGVPETIANLHKAGIKLWVCTGDKRETAIEIGYSAKVITPNMTLTQIVDHDDVDSVIHSVAKEFLHLVDIGKLPEYHKDVTDEIKPWWRTTSYNILIYLAWIQNLICCLCRTNTKNQKNVGVQTIEDRRKAVREYAHEIYGQGSFSNRASSISSSVFERAASARFLLHLDHRVEDLYNTIQTNSPRHLTSLHNPTTNPILEDVKREEVEQFSKAKQSIFEKLFAVDKDVRDGKLNKHLNTETLLKLKEVYKIEDGLHLTTTANEADGPRGLIVEGAALTHFLEKDPRLEEMIFAIANACEAVVACRVSPKQKALLVNLVKTYEAHNPITLAIGDGANDCGMIQEAHVGIGISGLEGQQAVNTSDFAIAQFRYLERLLLIHGRWAFYRMARLVLYCFYKNAVLAGLITVFQRYVLFSGQPLFNEWIISIFNFVTMIHITIAAFLDRDLEQDYVLANPQVYAAGPRNEHMSPRITLRWFFITLIHTTIIFWMSNNALQNGGMQTSAFTGLMRNRNDPGDGEGDFATFGTVIYTNLIILLGYKMLLESRSMTYGHIPFISKRSTNTDESCINRLPWSWFGLIVCLFGFWTVVAYLYSLIKKGDFISVANHMFNMQSISWYLFLLIPIASIVCDVTGKLFSNMYYPTQTQIHMEIANFPLRKEDNMDVLT